MILAHFRRHVLWAMVGDRYSVSPYICIRILLEWWNQYIRLTKIRSGINSQTLAWANHNWLGEEVHGVASNPWNANFGLSQSHIPWPHGVAPNPRNADFVRSQSWVGASHHIRTHISAFHRPWRHIRPSSSPISHFFSFPHQSSTSYQPKCNFTITYQSLSLLAALTTNTFSLSQG